MEWAKDLRIDTTEASAGWIGATLKKNGFQHICLHGEGNEMSEDEFSKIIGPWKDELNKLIEEKMCHVRAFTMLTKLVCFTRNYQTACISKKQA